MPAEVAGEVFAKAIGAEASDIYREGNDTIMVGIGREGPEKSYTELSQQMKVYLMKR